MKFFSVDSPLYRFMEKVKDLFLVNLCWLIGSLPVVTVGISTVAAFDVTLRMADQEEGYVVKQFIAAYKRNWKQGLPLGLIALACSYVVYLDFEFVRASENGSIPLIIAGCVSVFIFGFSLLYAFALSARYENTLLRNLKNSFRISMKYFFRSVFTVVIVAIELIVIFWNYTTMFAGLLLGPAFIIYTIAAMAKPVFIEIEKKNASGE